MSEGPSSHDWQTIGKLVGLVFLLGLVAWPFVMLWQLWQESPPAAIVVTAAVGFVGYRIVKWWRSRHRAHPGANLGTAGFAQQPGKPAAPAPPPEGTTPIRLGYLPGAAPGDSSAYWSKKHVLILAGTRAGKGVSLIIPNLFLQQRGAFVLDPKGENAKLTAAARSFFGPVAVLDPFGVAEGCPATGWNPLHDLHGEAMTTDAGALAAALVMTSPRDPDSHWTDNARELLRMLILHVCTTYPDDGRDLLAVRKALSNLLPKGGKREDSIERAEGDSSVLEEMAGNDAFDGIIADYGRAMLDTNERERASIISTARTHTQFLDDPRMRRSLAASAHALDFGAWQRGEALTVYVCLPMPYFATFSRWLRLCTQAALDSLTTVHRPPERSVMFILDELAQLGHLKSVETAFGLAAGYGVQLWAIFQDWGQVRANYEQTADSFWANAGARIVFGVADQTTTELVSKQAGITTVYTVSQQTGQARQPGAMLASSQSGQAVQPHTRPLLQPDEVARHYASQNDGSGLALVFLDGQPPLEVWRRPYFDDSEMDPIWWDPAAIKGRWAALAAGAPWGAYPEGWTMPEPPAEEAPTLAPVVEPLTESDRVES